MTIVGSAFLLYALAVQLYLSGWGLLASRSFRRHRPATRVARVFRSATQSPASSLILPAHNEEVMVVDAVRSALQIRHPDLRIVVVSDGSTDDTMERLVAAFDLVALGPLIDAELATDLKVNPDHIAAVWRSRSIDRLLVVERGVAAGAKAGAVNTGLLFCDTEWVAIADGDEVFDRHVMPRTLAEAADAPGTAAVGITLLPTNDGALGRDGAFVPRVPRRWLAGCQTVEYLRSFLLGRAGMAAVNVLPIVSGGFGVWCTADVLEVGGLRHGHLGEDMDLAVRMRRRRAEAGRHHRILQVPNALAWTEVPEDRRTLRNQRMRWQRGLTQILRQNHDTLWRREYRSFGRVGLGSALVFEWAAPFVEAAGYLVLVVFLVLGMVDLPLMAVLLLIALAAGWSGSFLAIVVEARHLGVYQRRGDVARLMFWALVEPFGYRQMTVWWRVRSLFGRQQAWGAMRRTGIGG